MGASKPWLCVGVCVVPMVFLGCGSSQSATSNDAGGTDGGTAISSDAAAHGLDGGATVDAGHPFGSEGGLLSVDSGPPPFPTGHVYIAGSRNAKVFEYDQTLNPVSSWTDPSFGTVEPLPGQDFSAGPAGMAFDSSGYLVVAAANAFCVFSRPDQLLACHTKYAPEPTENVIFDSEGNLYTTTSTGGTPEVRKYDSTYTYVTSFQLPTGSLSGVTCDPDGNLYVASQLTSTSVIYKVDKATFAVLDSIPIQGTVEGLQIASDGNILAGLDGGLGVIRVHASSPTVIVSTITNPDLTWAVPLTTDNTNRIYTADYMNGTGTAAANMFVFDPSGSVLASRLPSEVWGPFGMVVAGTVLPCGAFRTSQ